MQALIEYQAHCPYCDENISLVIDSSAGDQVYIEDCEVCCQPMLVSLIVTDDIEVILKRETD
ncbi:MAG: CPXCG motif-containing cysteine-rich protein [Pseudomonadales bacterium]